MIIDVTGIPIIPGNQGKDCPGNWSSAGWNCCCDECDYMICFLDTHDPKECESCTDQDCPRSSNSMKELPY